MLTEINCQHSD